MNTRWMHTRIVICLAVLGLSACRLTPPTPVIIEILVTPPAAATPTHRPPIAAATLPNGPTATPTPAALQIPPIIFEDLVDIPINLSAAPQKLYLGSCGETGGYLVEIIPGPLAPDGAYVVQTILPESDGQMWMDVLTYSAPGVTSPIPATARIRRITDWQIAGRYLLELSGGAWIGTEVSASALGAGYLVEINPLEPQPYGSRIEQARVLPEFYDNKWHDVLRLRVPEDQQATPVEVIVYTAPSSLSKSSFELKLKPNDWPGSGLDMTSSQAAYLVGIKPLTPMEGVIEKVVVQQEFDGRQWNTVLRAALGATQTTLHLKILVYKVP